MTIYKFKSPVTADLIMLGGHGDQFLRLIGKSPSPQGILAAAQLPEAIEAVRTAMALDDARLSTQGAGHKDACNSQESADQAAPEDVVSLRQRMSPMVFMMRAALAEHEDIVWGV